MKNFLFDHARAALKDGRIDWEHDDIEAMLVNADFAPKSYQSLYLVDIPWPARSMSTGVPLTGRQLIDGCISARDITFPAKSVRTDRGDIAAIVIYKSSGYLSTSPLIAYLGDAQGLPLTPNGNPILFHWDLEKPSIRNVALAINLTGQPQVMHPKVHAAFAEGDSTKPLELPTLTTVLYHLSSAAIISVADYDGSTELVKFRAAMRYMLEAHLNQNKAREAYLRLDSTAAFDSRTKELVQLAMEQLTATDTSAFPRDAQLIIAAIRAVYERYQSGFPQE